MTATVFSNSMSLQLNVGLSVLFSNAMNECLISGNSTDFHLAAGTSYPDFNGLHKYTYVPCSYFQRMVRPTVTHSAPGFKISISILWHLFSC